MESSKQITGNKEIGWGVDASNMSTSKLDIYAVLDTVVELNWKK